SAGHCRGNRKCGDGRSAGSDGVRGRTGVLLRCPHPRGGIRTSIPDGTRRAFRQLFRTRAGSYRGLIAFSKPFPHLGRGRGEGATVVNQRARIRKNGTAPTRSPSKALVDVVTISGPGVPFAMRP